MLRRAYALASIAFALSTLAATNAAATAQRTFVASYGVPTNTAFNCSISKPCRAFSEAIGVTTLGGEVIVLDSAGYGPVTITQSVSIVSPPGVYGGITVFSGNGVHIGGANIKVVLRGLTITGLGGAANNGINFTQGAQLLVSDCEISGFNFTSIWAGASNSVVDVKNTVMRNGSDGFYSVGSVRASLDGVHVAHNSSSGVVANSGAAVTIANSVLADNQAVGIQVSAFGGTVSDALVTRSTISRSSRGVEVIAVDGTARLVVDGTTINDAATAAFFFNNGGGTELIYSPQNNTVGFNNGIVIGGALTALGQH